MEGFGRDYADVDFRSGVGGSGKDSRRIEGEGAQLQPGVGADVVQHAACLVQLLLYQLHLELLGRLVMPQEAVGGSPDVSERHGGTHRRRDGFVDEVVDMGGSGGDCRGVRQRDGRRAWCKGEVGVTHVTDPHILDYAELVLGGEDGVDAVHGAN